MKDESATQSSEETKETDAINAIDQLEKQIDLLEDGGEQQRQEEEVGVTTNTNQELITSHIQEDYI